MKNSELSANQQRALNALLSSPSVEAAARRCGITSRQIWRYLTDETFKTELQQRRGEVLSASTTGLVSGMQLAAETLYALLEDAETPPTVRARVAQTVVELARKAVELDDVLARLEALEAQIKQQ